MPGARLWPAVKANAYGHGAHLVAGHLLELGCDTQCVAHAEEAIALREAGVPARFLVLSAWLPEQAGLLVAHDLEPVVCTDEALEALDREGARAGRAVGVHVAVDTGMGRIGVRPEDARRFVERCAAREFVRVRGIMSHFPRADERDKAFSVQQIERFRRLREETRALGAPLYHLANSAGILDLPDGTFDAVRPGIALYGLAPSADIQNALVSQLEPVLEWRTRITYLKEVEAGIGLSYGHTFRTTEPTLVATLPVGYGDGLSRRLSNRLDVLVGGRRCRQVGTITMDQSLVDVTPLRGRVSVGDEVVLIGEQDGARVTADELAAELGTINYEIVTAISRRVPRVPFGAPPHPVA